MSEWKVGDPFRVRDDCRWKNQRGWESHISKITKEDRLILIWGLMPGHTEEHYYYLREIEELDPPILPTPEFSLDEIIEAQELINGKV